MKILLGAFLSILYLTAEAQTVSVCTGFHAHDDDHYISTAKSGGTLAPPTPFMVQAVGEWDSLFPESRKMVVNIFFEGFSDTELEQAQTIAVNCAETFKDISGVKKEWWIVRALYAPSLNGSRYQPVMSQGYLNINVNLLENDMNTYLGSVQNNAINIVIVNGNIMGTFAGLAYTSINGISYALVSVQGDYGATLRHEASHIAAHAITNGFIRMAQDEYLMPSRPFTSTGYNVSKNPYVDFKKFIDAGKTLIYGYGYLADAYLVSEVSYMGNTINEGIMEDYWYNINHYGVGNIIYSSSHPNGATISVSGMTDTIAVGASLPENFVYEWRINADLVETNTTGIFAPLYWLYQGPVSVEMVIRDLSPIIDTTHRKTWSMNWTVMPDTSAAGTVGTDFVLTSVDSSPGNRFVINWEATREIGTTNYRLQSLYEGDTAFMTIAVIAAEGHNVTDTVLFYKYNHRPTCGTDLQYRVVAIDLLSESISDSSDVLRIECPVVGINTVAINNISVFPNPTQGMVTINAPMIAGTLTVIDILGQMVLRSSFYGTQTFNFAKYPSGMYYIVWTDANGQNAGPIRIVKN